MYELLLFVHVLAAFSLMVTVVVYSAFVLGAPAPAGGLNLAGWLWDIGGIGTLVLGVWLVFDQAQYDLLDGWILGALALWVAATMTGIRARWSISGRPGGDPPPTPDPSLVTWHWLRVAVTVGMLALMIFKPGA